MLMNINYNYSKLISAYPAYNPKSDLAKQLNIDFFQKNLLNILDNIRVEFIILLGWQPLRNEQE